MKTLLITFTLFLTLTVFGQYDVENLKTDSTNHTSAFDWSELKQKIYVGGEANLAFQPGRIFLFISPLIGYDITKRFSAGVSTTYQLLRVRNTTGTYNFNTFGAGIFARYRPIEQIILQTEFNQYNTVDFNNNPIEDRVNVNALMAGIGYANGLGNSAYYQILLMYDFIGDPNMPLSSIIRPQIHLKFGLVWYLG